MQLKYGGRTVMATVDDRGPYVDGRDWDLGQSTRAALGFDGGVGTVWASVALAVVSDPGRVSPGSAAARLAGSTGEGLTPRETAIRSG